MGTTVRYDSDAVRETVRRLGFARVEALSKDADRLDIEELGRILIQIVGTAAGIMADAKQIEGLILELDTRMTELETVARFPDLDPDPLARSHPLQGEAASE